MSNAALKKKRATVTSRLTAKSQTTIPQVVRNALHLDAGDRVRYVITDGSVTIEKESYTYESPESPFAYFTEWASEADEKAFAHLQPR